MKVKAKGLATNADGTIFLWKGKPLSGARVVVYVPRMIGPSLAAAKEAIAEGNSLDAAKQELFHWRFFGLAYSADTDLGILEGYVLGSGNKVMQVAGDVFKCTYEEIPFILRDRKTNEEIASYYPDDLELWAQERKAAKKGR